MKIKTVAAIIKEHWKNKKFIVHTCSLCDYPCGFIWVEGELFYDSGCHCLKYKVLEPVKEFELFRFILTHRKYIENKFKDENLTVN